MNKLKIFLILMLSVGLTAAYAWAGGDGSTAYEELSPAVFFGFAGPEHALGGPDAAVGDETAHRDSVAAGTERGYEGLSPEVFFGFADRNPSGADRTEMEGRMASEDVETAGSASSELSPSAFFYGYPSPDARTGCESC